MKLGDFINCVMICNFIFILIGLSMLVEVNNGYKYFNETKGENVLGVYYPNLYYCVWTKDRTESEIALTDNHEQCHHFVYMDKEHFCG